ncbi:serine/threonine protein kinase [Candidatus Uabimicrobium amorphum]|uniref:Serine/threonine protein kinase n=1 Tax=Uabimicrobium amorphum TaxID=2596890 RepID=A0A5S9IKW7_UABAM|nr:serine/threonine-protein kinase [Candidatus Uabimicrobium amorphum]BBM83759.1 serine/threonine protein kinase [Candidatus Uabimicrobium amorphum]
MKTYKANCCDNEVEVNVTENSVVKLCCTQCGKVMFSFPGAEEKAHTRKVNNSPLLLKQGTSAMLLGKYQIIKKISEGTFAKVYLAYDPDRNERVALKLLKFKKYTQKKRKSEMSRSFVNYFIREAQILLELNHHNIVKVKDTGNINGNPYLSMDYIPGKTLDEAVDELYSDYSMQLLIIHRLASALEYGYENFKIIHRDIKPQNVIMHRDQGNMPMLVDFGLAKSLGNHYHALTLDGVIAGTPHFMPVEHFIQRDMDHRVDIYALGATLYFMATKHKPYYKITDVVDIMHAIKSGKLQPIRELNPDIPDPIVEIAGKAMAVEKEDRYADYAELKTKIEEALTAL